MSVFVYICYEYGHYDTLFTLSILNYIDISGYKYCLKAIYMLLCDIRWHGNHYNLEERDGIVATLQDSHKLLDEVSEELRKSIRAQNTYVIGKSHDLRSPLNVIIGFTELLLDQVPGKINEEQRQALNDILASSRHLQNVIDDILGRLEKDRGVSDKSAP